MSYFLLVFYKRRLFHRGAFWLTDNVPGIADSGEFEIRSPGTVARLFAKVKFFVLKFGFIRQV